MPTIVAVAHCVASSGTQLSTTAVQLGGVTALTNALKSGPINLSERLIQSGGISMQEKVRSTAGVTIGENIVTASGQELTAGVNFILFDADFSRSANLFSVIGTSGSAPYFFDRSEYFHTPSEMDPNIMRDFSEAQQLMIFAQVPILSFSNFAKTSSVAHLITVKGEVFPPELLVGSDVVVNGSFELGFGSWVATTSGGGTVTVEGPSGGVDPYLTITPPDGVLYNRVTKPPANPNAIQLLRDSFSVRQPLPSSSLRDFGFRAAIRTTVNLANFRGAVFLRFLLEGSTSFLLRLAYSQFTVPSDANIPVELRGADIQKSITGLFSAANFASFTAPLLYQLMDREDFDFDTVEVSFAWGNTAVGTTFDVKVDLVQMTIDLPEEDLLRTTAIAHILTGHPVATQLPFTIEDEVDIIVTDETPPLFVSEQPARNTSFNPTTNRDMSFHVQDAGSAVDQATIDVFVDGLQVVNNGVVVTGTLWPVISKSVIGANDILYSLTRSMDFEYQSTITVSGTFADNASPANGATDTYQFSYWGANNLPATISGESDGTPPVVVALYPEDGAVQVSPDALITWRVTDNSAGVDPTQLKFYINGDLIIENDLALEGSFTRTQNSGRGFDYSYTPGENLPFGQTVTGTVDALDFVGNSTSFQYSFTVTPDDTLEIVNFFLADDSSVLITSGTYGSVEVRDLTHGVASGTTTLLQNGVEPFGLLATYSGSGPDRVIFTWPIQPNVDFREDILIEVHAENLFPGPFPVVADAQYLLRPGYDVTWPNKDNSGLSIAETIFPYLTNIFVSTQAKNFAVNYSTGSSYYRFLTENQAFADLGAVVESNINTADLSGFVNVLSPHFAYGKEMTLEVEVADLNGNLLSFTHVFTIENSD